MTETTGTTCLFQPTPPVSTAQLESVIAQSAERIASSIDSLSTQIAALVQLASDPQTGMVVRQQDDIAPGFNRAMMINAIRDQIPAIMNEINNPTQVS